MANLKTLTEVLEVAYDMDPKDIDNIANFIRAKGNSIYAIDHEYNNVEIALASDISSLEEEREYARSGEKFDYYEYDIYEEFNSPKDLRDGFLFGETYFFVDITEI
jgi:hypothetical protein